MSDPIRTLAAVRYVQACRRLRRPESPAELARMLDPTFVVTPTIRLLSDLAVRWVTQPDQRHIVTTSPRTGKSQSLAIWTPVWALMVNPNLQIVIVAHSDDLAQEHSRKAREIIKEHAEFLGYRLAHDKTAVGRWRVEGHAGGMLATGINSGVVGFGADCVAPDTRITTEHGVVTAERAYREGHVRIWAFDHTSGVAGWHRVEARRRIDGRELVTVRTQHGNVLACTSDHRIYTRRGYVAAGQLEVSDEILSLDGADGVSSVWGGIPGDGGRSAQKDLAQSDRDLLLDALPVGSVRRREAVGVLCGVSWPGAAEPEADVFEGMSGSAQCGETSTEDLSDVWRPIPSEVVAPEVLRASMRGLSAFTADDRLGQFAFQDGDELRELVSVDAADDLGARRSPVRGVRPDTATAGVHEPRQAGHEVTAGHPPHQRAPGRQSSGELDHDVLVVPCHSSQVSFDAVSSVTRDRSGTHSVYDFQVEGARNFFADGLLVHNCMIIDDPVKDAAEADSAAHRKRVINEYRGSLATRIHPGGSTLIVLTRWNERDLAGELLASEPDVWCHTNIPAVSEAGVPDALGRAPGVAMVSALGYTPEHYAALRRTVGERVWYAQYMGVPSAPEGGLVKRVWLDRWRLPVAPSSPVLTVVGVDPSDSGSGDSCGLVASSLSRDGVVALIADQSAPMTSDAWASAAVKLAVDVGASEIAVEGFAARETYTRVVKEALARAKVTRPIKVSSWPPKGSGRGGGDAIARSSALLQALEVGTARLAGHFPTFEDAAVSWQTGQHQPDQLAAFVVAHDVLVHAAGREWSLAVPTGSLGGAAGVRPGVPGGVGGPVTDMGDWLRRRVG